MVFIPLKSFVLVLIVVLGPIGISLLYKLLQLPFSYELLYLLLQISTVLNVMTMILVKTTIFLLVAHIG